MTWYRSDELKCLVHNSSKLGMVEVGNKGKPGNEINQNESSRMPIIKKIATLANKGRREHDRWTQ
jgi:hypothetical protein